MMDASAAVSVILGSSPLGTPPKKKSAVAKQQRIFGGVPSGTRTPGPLLRRQLLYPPELRAHVVIPLGSFMTAVVCRHTLREV